MNKEDIKKYSKYTRQNFTNLKPIPIRKKIIKWPDYKKKIFLGKFIARTIWKKDIPKLVEFWKIAFPTLIPGPGGWLFDPKNYNNIVAFKDNWEKDSIKKSFAIWVVEKVKTKEIVGALLCQKIDDNLEIDFPIGAVHPKYRKLGVSQLAVKMMEEMAEMTDAEYIMSFASSNHEITQNTFFKMGWKLAGVFPGYIIEMCCNGKEHRSCVAFFYKFLKKGEEISSKQEDWRLCNKAKQVFNVLKKVNS